MVTIKTRRGKEVQLRTIPEWWEITSRGGFSGMVALEQAYYQSARYKVCVDCLGTKDLHLNTGRALIKSTDFYMCQDCLDYYEEKHKGDI